MAPIKKYTLTDPYLDLACALGEGPFWDRARNTLRFVDIKGKKLHTVDLTKGPTSHREFALEHCVTVTADIEGNDDEFVYGGKFGYGVMHKDTGAVRTLKGFWGESERGGGKPSKEERMRANDGAVDSRGRFWVGTMNDDSVVAEFSAEGVLFCLDGGLGLRRAVEGLTIPNGTTWSRDDGTMYFTDSPTRTVQAIPWDAETGEMRVAEGKTFFTVEGGVPDGHCQDEEGHFWIAGHGTGKVFRVSPEGEVVAEIELPTRCVTCPAFCGTELFITTMDELEPEKYPESVKMQGRLFKVDVGVRGRPMNKFKMDVKA